MTRRLVLAMLLLMTMVVVRSMAQDATTGTVMTGTVRNITSGQPVIGAHVLLIRYATNAESGGEDTETLAQALTDLTGHFSLGGVALKTALEFPLESSLALCYVVSQDGRKLGVERAAYTAPRRNGVVTSVAADLYVSPFGPTGARACAN